MLKLDGAARGGDGGHEQRRQVVDAHRDTPGRGGTAAASKQRQTSTTRGAASRASGDAELGQDAERADCRTDRRELTAHASQPTPEALAAHAVAHVLAGGGAGAQPTVVGISQLLANQQARGVTSLGGLRECHPRAHEQRLDRADRDSQRDRKVGVGHPGQLPHEQGRTLLLRQATDVLDQAPQRLTEIDLGQRIVNRGPHELEELRRRRRRPAKLVDAAIVSHPEQPGPKRELLVGGPQPGIGANEDILEGVLGVLAAREHLAGIREQTLVIALVDRPECLVVPGPEQRHQLLIGAEAQEGHSHRDPPRGHRGRSLEGCCSRSLECGCFHLNPLGNPNESLSTKFLFSAQDNDTVTCLISV